MDSELADRGEDDGGKHVCQTPLGARRHGSIGAFWYDFVVGDEEFCA